MISAKATFSFDLRPGVPEPSILIGVVGELPMSRSSGDSAFEKNNGKVLLIQDKRRLYQGHEQK
jgi:hypothetical protein